MAVILMTEVALCPLFPVVVVFQIFRTSVSVMVAPVRQSLSLATLMGPSKCRYSSFKSVFLRLSYQESLDNARVDWLLNISSGK